MYSEPKYYDTKYAESVYNDPRYSEHKYSNSKYSETQYPETGYSKMSPTQYSEPKVSPTQYPEAGYSKMSSAQCPDASGTMPSCAPLAVPYVPYQQKGSKRYNHADALNNGTLYPGLNLPYHLKVEAANVAGGPLGELQALDFVVLELALYLDTHPDDNEAFELYKKYAAMAKDARKQYTAAYGPLTHMDPSDTKSYAWINDPWPWNYVQKGWGK